MESESGAAIGPMPYLSRVRENVSWRNWYTLSVLIIVYVLSFIDRQVLGLLVEPIKRDLHLTDTQVSLCQGFAFAVCLALCGLPMGWLVDRHRRVTIIALGILVWSAMTSACGLASGFTSLLLLRIGVGCGEAALTPAAHSIVSDTFPQARLGFALGVFGIGSYIGSGFALLGGGLLLQHLTFERSVVLPWYGLLHPWQMVFIVVGLLGLPVTPLLLSLSEPTRRCMSHEASSSAVTRTFFRHHGHAMIRVNLTAAFVAMAVYASTAWIPSFYIRTYHVTGAFVGTRYGVIVIICGICGTIGGGALGDYAVARGIRGGRLLVMTIASACAVPFAFALASAPTIYYSLVAMIPFALLTTIALGVLPSAQQSIAHSRVRGITAALGVAMVNVIGMGLGPTIVAAFTDFVVGNEMLVGRSLATLLPVMLCIAALVGWSSLSVYRRSALSATEVLVRD